MMKLNFKISEFNISGQDIPEAIADDILKHHIEPMQDVRDDLGIPITASQKSGYRPPSWEKKRGRNGESQHCFKLVYKNGKRGAVDWTCEDFKKNKDRMLESMIKHTDYTRIAIYATFIHADYKTTVSGKREIYTSDNNSNWKFLRYAN